MRTFTKQEWWILKKASELKKNKGMHSISLGDICVAFLDNEYIHIHLYKDLNIYNVELMFNIDNYNPVRGSEQINKKREEIEKKIIDTIFLLKYLKENRLLFEITGASSNEEFDIVRNNYNKERHFRRDSNFDKITEKFIVDLFVNKQYFIRQEFIDFVDNNFKTVDDRRFRKGQFSTWAGIIVAFLIGLGSILLSIHSQKKSTEKDIQQMIHVDSYFNEIKEEYNRKMGIDSLRLDSLNNQLNILIDKTEKNRPLKKIDAFIINNPENSTSNQ